MPARLGVGPPHDGYKALPNIHASKTFTQEEVDEAITQHNLWQDSNGTTGERAYFAHCVLDGLDLSEVDLSGAAFEETSLKGCNFKGSRMVSCSFRSSWLTDANLAHAWIQRSNFLGCDMTNVNLYNTETISTVGNGKELKTVNICKYFGVYTTDYLQFNCARKTIEWWRNATREEIIELDPNYLDDNIDEILLLLQVHLDIIDAAPAKACRNIDG